MISENPWRYLHSFYPFLEAPETFFPNYWIEKRNIPFWWWYNGFAHLDPPQYSRAFGVSWISPGWFLPLSFQKQGEVIPGQLIHELLNELDTNRNGQVELDEYLQVREVFGIFLFVSVVCWDFHWHVKTLSYWAIYQMMSAIKSGAVSHSRFAKMAEMDYKVR